MLPETAPLEKPSPDEPLKLKADGTMRVVGSALPAYASIFRSSRCSTMVTARVSGKAIAK